MSKKFAKNKMRNMCHKAKHIIVVSILTSSFFFVPGCTRKVELTQVLMDMRSFYFSRVHSPDFSSYNKEAIIGAVTETTLKNGNIESLMTLVDGTTSYYDSATGAIIGLGENNDIKKLAIEYVADSKNYLSLMTETKAIPVPEASHVIFYFLTPTKILTSQPIPKHDLSTGNTHFLTHYVMMQKIAVLAKIMSVRNKLESTKTIP